MTVAQNAPTTDKPNDKELNFRLQEKAMQDKYERMLAQERQGRLQAEQEAQRLSQERSKVIEEDEDDPEPYVDHKKLNKKLAKFGEQTQKQTQSEIQNAVQMAIREHDKNNWLKNHDDFDSVLQYAEKLAQSDPDLAESILDMPQGFERQKLVYKNIKALGLHKELQKQSTIQEKVDANRRSPYYQPSGVGSAPYASMSDFSSGGQKQAYDKMQELKSRLRL